MNLQNKGAAFVYILILALVAVSFGLGRLTAEPVRILEEHERTDTLVLRDTVTRYVPQYVHRYTRDTIRVEIRELVHDTVAVYLPRETRVYEDSLYRAEVSGYQPSLDRIDIFTQTQVVTKETVRTVKRRTHWGLGVSAGYGVAINAGGKAFTPAPYIGIGISYNLISW